MLNKITIILIIIASIIISEGLSAKDVSAEGLYNKARELYGSRKYKESIAIFENLIEKFPDYSYVKRGYADSMIAYCYQYMGNMDKVFETKYSMLEKYPDYYGTADNLLFCGMHLIQAGKTGEGWVLWDRLAKDYSDKTAAKYLKRVNIKPVGAGIYDIEGPTFKALTPGDRVSTVNSAYVVLAGMPKADPYYQAAKKMAEFRNGTIVRFDPENPDAVKEKLKELGARYVCVVVKPGQIDINLLRRMLILSIALDDDPFCDFAFGFITGKTAKGAEKFVDNIIKADTMELAKRAARMAVSAISRITELNASSIIYRAGYPGKCLRLGTDDKNNDIRVFMKKNISILNGAGVICISGNGDSEGVWLFNGHRNMEPEKHWEYSPGKAGYDPKGEMPRIMAADYKKLKLFPSVCWSGVCHMGVVEKTYLLGDTVATYGRTEHLTLHKIPVKNSQALTLIEKGVVALSCSMSANHGALCLKEQAYVFETGACLGDMMRNAYHLLVVDENNGKLKGVGIFKQGGAHRDKNVHSAFAGEPQNRMLYGDPRYQPFTAVDDKNKYQLTSTEISENKSGFNISCTLPTKSGLGTKTIITNAGSDPLSKKHIYCTVEVPVEFKSLRVARVTSVDANGKAIFISRIVMLLEYIDGKHFLHLSAKAPSSSFKSPGVTLKYEVALN
ncbi:tol-pal system YbgF family protein [Planctomycetota bacterium]